MADTSSTPAPQTDAPAADLMREQRMQRNLKILIGGMSALILLGLGAVFIGMAGFGPAKRASSPAAATTAIATPGGGIALELPKGAKIMSVSISGNRLAVYHEAPSGTGITVIDLETGRRIADIKPVEAVPKN